MNKTILLVILTALLFACQKNDDTPKTVSQAEPTTHIETTSDKERPPLPTREPASPKRIFNEPITAPRLERPSEALPYWRDAAGGSRPALILFSIHPFLQPLSEEQQQPVATLLATGTADDFIEHGSIYRPEPILTSTQSLSAALSTDLFSQIIWVFPSPAPSDQLLLDTFRQQVVDSGFLTEAEGLNLQLRDGVYTGTVRGVPFRAVHPSALPVLDEPVVIHFDLGYFKGLYKNEIKTPLYPTLQQTVLNIQSKNWQALSTTLSYSTIESELSLETRFLINRLAELLADPALLEKDMPPHWTLHSEALYTINFFLETKVTELLERAVSIAPDDPAVLYALSLRKLRDGNLAAALELIDRAASIDNGYALEYNNLADKATEGNDFATADMLLKKAHAAFPSNPFIDLQRAEVLLRMNKLEEGRALISELQKLPWSHEVHGQMPQTLNNLLTWEPDQTPTVSDKKEPQK